MGLHEEKVYSTSCRSDTKEAPEVQGVNCHAGYEVDPTVCPEDSLNVPLCPNNVLKRTARPVRPEAFRS